MSINKISATTKAAMHRKSAAAMPDRPSQRGYSPEEIRRIMVGVLLDDQDSLLAEINRVADETDRAITLLGEVVTAGYVTIPATTWTDTTPSVGVFTLNGMRKGTAAILFPADQKTHTAAKMARLSAHPVSWTIDEDSRIVEVVRENAVVDILDDLEFVYVIVKTGDENRIVTIVGVDESAGGTDESDVQRIIRETLPSWVLKEEPPTEVDPNIAEWARQKQKPGYSAEEVGADPKGTAEELTESLRRELNSQLDNHNTLPDAHYDIRLQIQGLNARLTALADSDDVTLDQLSELVKYIKRNREVITIITNAKVNVDDIINNLTTNVENKPLSAAQGVILKGLIDKLTTLPNPQALTILGKTYTGGTAVNITIDDILAALPASEEVAV